jgi:hypothetical protein
MPKFEQATEKFRHPGLSWGNIAFASAAEGECEVQNTSMLRNFASAAS